MADSIWPCKMLLFYYYLQHHLTEMTAQNPSPRKVAFFVPTRCLVWQQWKMCQEYLSEYRSIGVTGASKPGEKVAVGGLLPLYDVIVMTPQMLVDALKVSHVITSKLCTSKNAQSVHTSDKTQHLQCCL